MTDDLHYRTCPLCEATCGLELTMRDGTVVRVRGDRNDVFSKGYICPKGSLLHKLADDPDRLRSPLIKRDGEFVEATWDEAFAAVAEGLGRVWDAGDRNAVAVYLGNPTVHNLGAMLGTKPFLRALGTRNLYSASTVDQMPRHVSSGAMFGRPDSIAVPDLDRTDYLLMLGANPAESNGSLCTAPDFMGRVAAIRARGGRVVVVDPRRTRTVHAADEHVTIRPGTDAWWLGAIVTEIARGPGCNLGALAPHVSGLDAVLAALAPLDAASVAERCGIDAATTRRIAVALSAAPTAAVYGRIGTHTTEWGTLASWLADVINVITGNLDRPGGAMFPTPAIAPSDEAREPGGRGWTAGRWASRVRGVPEVRGEFPVATLADEIETPGPGRVRALITHAGNPVRSAPNSERLDRALASLEFMVSIDIYLNETTRHADVILPSPSPLAKAHCDLAFMGLSVRNVVNYSPAIRPADHPDEPGLGDFEIFATLALIASGLGPDADRAIVTGLMVSALATEGGFDVDHETAAATNKPPVEAILDLMLRRGWADLTLDDLRAHPHGIDLGALVPRLPAMLRTPSGTVELAAPPIMREAERLVAALATPPAGGLVLIGRRHERSNNSWMHNIERLVSGRSRCTLEINPEDACAAGIADGDEALVESAAGSLVATAEVTDAIARGTVCLPHGWGHDVAGTRQRTAASTAGVNSNVLTTDDVIDPLSGNARLNGIPVSVRAVAPAD